jgi:hypothetical protein
MMQFWELDMEDQLVVLSRVTKIVKLEDFQENGAILPNVCYDQRTDLTCLSSVLKKISSTDALIQSVCTTLVHPQFVNSFQLNKVRAICLQKDGKNSLICSNLLGYDSFDVVVIYLDDLIDSPQIEYHYADKLPNRWKVLYSGIGFGLVCLLLDSANKFPIRIL